MIERALLDTGPLVSIVRKRETTHSACVEVLKRLRPPLWTCWPVLTEAAWLLRNEPGANRVLRELIQTGVVELVELDQGALLWTLDFMDRYASAGAQLADAALMWIAEQRAIDTIFTLDRRDFAIYRTRYGHTLTIVPGIE